MRGTIKFYNLQREFGFIVPEDGAKEVYFNKGSLPRARAYDPVEGDVVDFEVRDARLGKIAVHIEQTP
jgi:cold shock CspA family protein